MQEYYYCEYCGTRNRSLSDLTGNNCLRHPDGSNKGRHKLYEGGEKLQYLCKYCGTKKTRISELTGNRCSRHPDGVNKGNHSPAL